MELSGNAIYDVYRSIADRVSGGRNIVFQTMETGELTSIMVYAMQILMSLMMVTFVFVLIMIAEASTDRIEEVLKKFRDAGQRRRSKRSSGRFHIF